MTKPIRVDHASLDEARQRMQRLAKEIDEQLDLVRSGLTRLSWEGADRDAYEANQREWDAAVRDLNAVLTEIAGAVGLAHQNFVDTETTNTRLWA